jgi:hypothetical protein
MTALSKIHHLYTRATACTPAGLVVCDWCLKTLYVICAALFGFCLAAKLNWIGG